MLKHRRVSISPNTPVADASLKDAQLETDMAFTREVISMGHAARNRSGIKTRQPLAEITIGDFRMQKKRRVNRLAELGPR